jgi:hypothetical protein
LAAVGLRRISAGVLLALLQVRAARAYTVSTIVTNGCHEQLTLSALGDVRATMPDAAPPLPIAGQDAALVADLPFELDPAGRDLGAVALLLGVRDNDLKGRGSTDLEALAQIHGNPATQEEHCLRALDDHEPTGTALAVARCRAYIRARVGDALDHLAADGTPDPESRLGLPVSLAIRGRVTAVLPGTYVHLGQALHALQDSFSHSYRTADSRAVTVSLTWLHPVDDDLDEAVTGPPHSSPMDACGRRLDAFRAARADAAVQASSALLAAALGPGTRDDRLARVDAVLDAHLSVAPGCTVDNGWCGAPERAYRSPGGCQVAGGVPRTLGVGLLLVVIAGARRRRARAVVLATLLFAIPARALANPGSPITPRGESAAKPPVASKAPEARFAERPALGLVVSAGGSLNHAAMNVGLGLRLRLTPRWLVGVDAEWNPWASLEGEHVRPGAFNAYATIVRRWSMQSDRFDVRTTAHLGTSTVLFDLYGVPSGTTGLFAGVSLLGLEWKASRNVSVVVDPADVVYPLPQLHGAPFGYLQYRLTIGLQWGA